MKTEFIFEIANEQNCEELSKLKLKIWETTYRNIYPKEKFDNFDFKKQTEKFKGYVSDENGVFYVAKDNKSNAIVGYCYAGFSSRAFEKGVPEIILLYVLKEYQHQGIGRQFFEKCKQYFKDKGYAKFIISCNKYNHPAREFYAKMGGQIVHTDDDCDDKSLPQVNFLFELK